MAKKQRIPPPVVAALLLLPVAGLVAWLLYDASPRQGSVQPSRVTHSKSEGAQLSVIVTAAGQPAEGASVVALSQGKARRVRSQRTDAQGRAELFGVPEGKTIVGVRLMGYQHAKRELTIKGTAPQTIEFSLEARESQDSPQPPASAEDSEDDQRVVSGRVENTRGEPVYQAKVGLSTGDLPRYVQSDLDGKFEFRGVPGRKVDVFVSAPGHAVTPSQTVSVGSTNVVLVMPEESSVFGKLEVRQPMDDLVVRLCNYEKLYDRDRCIKTRRYKGQPKSFELLKVPAGEYDVVFLRGKEELRRVSVVVEAGRAVEVPPQVL